MELIRRAYHTFINVLGLVARERLTHNLPFTTLKATRNTTHENRVKGDAITIMSLQYVA